MRHEHCRCALALALPAVEQGAVRQTGKSAFFGNIRKQLRQLADELFKLRVVFKRMVVVGDGFAFYKLRKGLDGGIAVKFNSFNLALFLRLWGEHKGSCKDDHYNRKDKIQYYHCAPPQSRFFL